MTNNLIVAKPLANRWQTWLRAWADAGARFVNEGPLEVSTDEQRELVSIRLALYARALTLFETCVFLIENDRQLDFRIHSRNVLDTTIHLIKLDSDPAFIQAMKDDDYKSRHKRASMYLTANGQSLSEQARAQLHSFVDQGAQGKKFIEIAKLLEGSDFERLYRSYRDISGDAAHVTVSALNRHYVEHPDDGSAILILHPALDETDMRVTVCELAMAMNISTLLLMPLMERSPIWDQFRELTSQYKGMVGDGLDFLEDPGDLSKNPAL